MAWASSCSRPVGHVDEHGRTRADERERPNAHRRHDCRPRADHRCQTNDNVTAQVRAGPDVHAIGNLAVVINRRARVYDDVTSHTRAAIDHAACHNDGAFSDFNVPSDRGCGMNDDREPAATFDKPRGDLHSDVIVADGYDTRTDFRLSRYQIVAAAYDFISHYLRPMFFHGVIADVRDHVTPFTLDRVDHNLGMAARAENENLLALIHSKWW
jgi:hypothetical protein